jgi:thiol-disulfide isomerase/thioredoxin
MKKLVFPLILCLLSVKNQAQNFVFRGKIKNPISKMVNISFAPHGKERISKNIELAADGSFEFKEQIDDIAYLDFTHIEGENYETACTMNFRIIEPNDNLTMTFDAKDYWNTVKYEGNAAEKFNYYKEDYVEMDVKRKWGEEVMKYEGKTKELFAYLDSVDVLKFKILEKYKTKVTPLFYKMWAADTKALIHGQGLNVLFDKEKQRLNPIRSLPFELQEKFFKDLPIQNDTIAKTALYLSYVNQLAAMMMNDIKESTKNTTPYENQSQVLINKVLLAPSLAEKINADMTMGTLSYLGIKPESEKMIKEFKENYPQSKMITRIDAKYKEKEAFMAGKPAKGFKVRDLEGKEVKLEDYKGKVVYLDFWASWCGTCIAEMKPVKQVKEHFKDKKDVVFLYVSLDSNEKSWKEAIKKHEINGLHAWGEKAFNDPIAKDYGIIGIPSYFVIGKEGNFHAIQPPRPSENEGKDLIAVLEAALKR